MADRPPAEIAAELGPRSTYPTCIGCPAHVAERWREPSGDGETDDTGTENKCRAANDRVIDGSYGSVRPQTPMWCPHPRTLHVLTPAEAAMVEAVRAGTKVCVPVVWTTERNERMSDRDRLLFMLGFMSSREGFNG